MDSERLLFKGSIPIELVEDILLRLPVKAIGRCMLACQRWYSLVKSAQFNKRHFVLSKTKAPHVLIVQEDRYSTFSESDTNLIKQESGKIPIPLVDRDFYIMGSCRGLVLVQLMVKHGWIVLLWNPLLEKSKLVDTFICDEWSETERQCPVYALGFHEATDDYRVVRISGVSKEYDPETEVDVFSFAKDSWEGVDGFLNDGGLLPSIMFHKEMPKYVNGAVHWLAAAVCDQEVDQEVHNRYVVLSFDFDNEAFKVIELPHHYRVNDQAYSGFELFELQGKLALLGNYYEEEHYFTWVMMNYPLVESWTHIGRLFQDEQEKDVWPLVCTKEENCIFTAEGDMLRYCNAKENKTYELEVSTPYQCPVIVDFVDCLVLLDVENVKLDDVDMAMWDELIQSIYSPEELDEIVYGFPG